MLDRAEREAVVSIGWLMEQLGGRSFGLALLVMGVLGIVPGVSTVAALMVVWLAVQMMRGQEAAVLPRLVARRSIGVERLARVIGLVAPRLAWVEQLVRPRWPMLFQTTERLTGFMMLLLGLSMLSPVPFSQIVPAPIIMLLALAYLEEDGIALLFALIAALAALSITAATIWEPCRRSTGSIRRDADSRGTRSRIIQLSGASPIIGTILFCRLAARRSFFSARPTDGRRSSGRVGWIARA